MDKIIYGDVVGLPNPRPDWNQNDPKKADYIKNKPNNLATTEMVEESIAGVAQDIANITQDIADVEQSIVGVNQSVAEVGQGVSNANQNIITLEQNIVGVEQDIVGVNQNIADIEKNIIDIEQGISNVSQNIIDIEQNIAKIEQDVAQVEQNIINKEVGISFATIHEMVSKLLAMDKIELKVPFGLYIIESSVPDFWVCEVLDDRLGYVYPGDEEFLNQVRQGPVQIGHYKISILETKIDLSGYVPTNRTIAGVSLDHDLTAEEVRDNLGITEIIDNKLKITIYEEDEVI